MAFELMPDLNVMVCYKGKNSPTEADWDVYVNALESTSADRPLRILVITHGAHLSRLQQQKLLAFHRRRQPKVALLTSATSVGFVASIMALTNPGVRTFLPAQRASAGVHLGLGSADVDAVWAVVDRLHEKLRMMVASIAPRARTAEKRSKKQIAGPRAAKRT